MRKYAIAVVVAIAAIATVSLAQGAEDPIQSIDASISPTTLDKKKPKSVQLGIDIHTYPNTGASVLQDQPPNATKTVVDFPKNLSFDTDAVPHCKGTPEELANTTPEQAIEICGAKSIISVPAATSSHVTVDTAPTVADPTATFPIPVVLTAFNGAKPNTLIFHNRADIVNNTTVLLEKLKPSKDKHYGTSLITNIPPVLAGGPDDFKATIKKGTIVSAVCKSKNQTFRATSNYTNYKPGTDVVSTTKTSCTQKKSKKKK